MSEKVGSVYEHPACMTQFHILAAKDAWEMRADGLRHETCEGTDALYIALSEDFADSDWETVVIVGEEFFGRSIPGGRTYPRETEERDRRMAGTPRKG